MTEQSLSYKIVKALADGGIVYPEQLELLAQKIIDKVVEEEKQRLFDDYIHDALVGPAMERIKALSEKVWVEKK